MHINSPSLILSNLVYFITIVMSSQIYSDTLDTLPMQMIFVSNCLSASGHRAILLRFVTQLYLGIFNYR